jgi:hypothetical protein
MTEESYLRTGQVAKRLGRSSYEVRRLLECGLIQGEYTGNQWRIALREVERLEREGVPDVPVSLRQPEDESDYWEDQDDSTSLPATPSKEVIAATDDVAIEQARVQTARHRLERRKIERDLAETEDFFQEREARERERKAAEQSTTQAAAAENQRIDWRDSWLTYAKRSIPREANPEVLWLEVYPLVWEALEKLRPTPARDVTQGIVDAIVSKSLEPWRNFQQMKQAVEAALDKLPWGLRHNARWYERAVRAAAVAVNGLGATASLSGYQSAAAHAVEPVKNEFEHAERLEEVASRMALSGATTDEREDARDAVRKALAGLPVGASTRQLEAARDTTIEPLRAKIRGREDKKMREGLLDFWGVYRLSYTVPAEEREFVIQKIRTAFSHLPEGTPRSDLEAARDRLIEQAKRDTEKRKAKTLIIDVGLREIGPYLRKLQGEGWEFEDSLSSTESELNAPIRKELEEELTGEETADQVLKILRRLVREEMDINS